MKRRFLAVIAGLCMLAAAGFSFAESIEVLEYSLNAASVIFAEFECSHQHDAACFVLKCLHTAHDDVCGYIEGDAEAICTHACSGESDCLSISCTHVCAEECQQTVREAQSVSDQVEETENPASEDEVPDGAESFEEADAEEDVSYRVIIPSSIELDRGGGALTIQASELQNLRSVLTVSVFSENDFYLLSSDGSSVAYMLMKDETAIHNGDAAAVFQEDGSQTLSFRIDEIPQAGIYKDTLTFSISLN